MARRLQEEMYGSGGGGGGGGGFGLPMGGGGLGIGIVLVGVLLALLVNEPFPGRGIVRVLLISPFFVMPAVNALLWKHMMMNPIYGVLAGIAGVLLGMFLGVSSYSAGPLTGSAFSIVVLGGLGSVSGSLIAAYVVGYIETMTAYLIGPSYRFIPSLLLLVVVMYVRPRGLLGRR